MEKFLTWLKENYKKVLIGVAAILMLYLVPLCLSMALANQDAVLGYNEFFQLIEEEKVESVTLKTYSTEMDVYVKGENVDEVVKMKTIRLSNEKFMEDLQTSGVEITYESDTNITVLEIMSLMFKLLFYGLFVCVMLSTLKMTKGSSGFSFMSGKEEDYVPDTRFSDVAGLTEEKEELKAVLDTFKNAKKYTECGGRPIKGVLLEGPPGTGKTLLAKAVAGEAGVNFLSYSGSDFVHLFVGGGAGKVRSVFDKARKLAPCVIFIDEIDQLCKKRGVKGSSADQEYDQTLVALLDRLQGAKFDMSDILLIGATNQLDTMDDAILRPGRIDKVIHVGNPYNSEDRKAIIKVHTKNKKLAEEVTLDNLSRMFFGLSGAEIEMILSEAVTVSMLNGNEGLLTLEHIDNAYMKLITKGVAKKPNPKHTYTVAVHEAGHAIMNLALNRKITKVAIQPYSSGIGGITVVDGEQADFTGLRTKEDFIDDVKVLYGGVLAEKIIIGKVTQGCSNDIERATSIINTIVGMVGMGDSLISYKVIGDMSPLVFSNADYIQALKDLSLQIETEVTEFLSQETIKAKILALTTRLIEEQTVYNLESLEDIVIDEEKP